MGEYFPPQLLAGCLFLISEVMQSRRDELGSIKTVLESARLTKTSRRKPSKNFELEIIFRDLERVVSKFDKGKSEDDDMKRFDSDDDEEEHYADVKEEEAELKDEPGVEGKKSAGATSWVHRKNITGPKVG